MYNFPPYFQKPKLEPGSSGSNLHGLVVAPPPAAAPPNVGIPGSAVSAPRPSARNYPVGPISRQPMPEFWCSVDYFELSKQVSMRSSNRSSFCSRFKNFHIYFKSLRFMMIYVESFSLVCQNFYFVQNGRMQSFQSLAFQCKILNSIKIDRISSFNRYTQ